ncbi:MAG: phage minor capsid protein [Hungatella sp.]|nr:phage minor capsid protein [Hungatella sp.]
MTPDELEKLPKPMERIMTAMEMSIMAEIVERIENAGLITPLIDWTLGRVAAIGESKARIKKIISNALKDSDLQIDKIYEHAIKADYITNKELYQAAGKDYIPYQENKWLQQIVSAVKAQTRDSLRPMENITQTTGFNVMIEKEKVFTPLSEYLEKTLDKAMMEIATGVKTYSQAVNGVIDEMTSSGLRTVDYASGRSDRIEVAARRAVMTGVAQLTDKVNEKNAKELDTDYWEVEWHMGARNTGTGFMNHQSWQGKVYSSAEMRTVCGLGEMLGFAGINCYHIRFPFLPGISKRKYTDEWLTEQNRKENTKKAFNGKEYDTYGAIQYQRKLERTIRKLKEDIKLLEKAKAEPDDISAAKIRLRVTSKTYTDLSKEMDIPQQLERIYTPKTASMQ